MFLMRLEVRQSGEPPAGLATACEEADENTDITVILTSICHWFADSGQVVFTVAGFGQSPWPVDVRTDLAIVMEQLPEALNALNRVDVGTFTIDFYEQGIERTLVFDKNDKEVRIRCISGTTFVPIPREEVVTKEELKIVLSELARMFVQEAEQRCPGVTRHDRFQEWIRSGHLGKAVKGVRPNVPGL